MFHCEVARSSYERNRVWGASRISNIWYTCIFAAPPLKVPSVTAKLQAANAPPAVLVSETTMKISIILPSIHSEVSSIGLTKHFWWNANIIRQFMCCWFFLCRNKTGPLCEWRVHHRYLDNLSIAVTAPRCRILYLGNWPHFIQTTINVQWHFS